MSRMRLIVWGILLTAFFVSTAFALRLPEHFVFVSPDENAAFTFSRLLSEEGTLHFSEPLNERLYGLLHPRSTVPFGATILPGSFLGLVLLTAGVGGLFGAGAALLVTPLLAVLAVLAWRKTVAVLFHDVHLGDLAGFFLLIHPAFWYYSGRVMMHNVSFVAFLIFAGWFMAAEPIKKYRLLNYLLAGFSLGMALLIRLSEASWVLGALAVIFVLYRRNIGWRAIGVTAVGIALMGAIQLGLNAEMYGSPWTNGYTVSYDYGTLIAETMDATATAPSGGASFNLVLPFGFHERVILHNVWGYGLWLYPVFSVLAVIGMILAVAQKDPQQQQQQTWRMYVLGTLLLAVWLALVYGSWKIADNPDPFAVTLGNSHVRYWLPLFVLASAYCARVLLSLVRTPFVIKPGDIEGVFRHGVAAVLLVAALGSSVWLVYWSEDGFLHSRAALKTFVEKEEQILSQTEDNAIIIVDRADKYLFPERRVLVPLRNDRTYAVMPLAVEEGPLYYFGITFPEKDMAYLNDEKLASLGLRIEHVATMNEESLYRIIKR